MCKYAGREGYDKLNNLNEEIDTNSLGVLIVAYKKCDILIIRRHLLEQNCFEDEDEVEGRRLCHGSKFLDTSSGDVGWLTRRSHTETRNASEQKRDKSHYQRPRSYATAAVQHLPMASRRGVITVGKVVVTSVAIVDSTFPWNVTRVTGLDISRNSVTSTNRNSR